jgi:hypothetical protein
MAKEQGESANTNNSLEVPHVQSQVPFYRWPPFFGIVGEGDLNVIDLRPNTARTCPER